MRRNPCATDPGWNVVDDDLDRGGEALGVGELLAIVHDVHAEAHLVGLAREVKADVSGADDIQLG